MRSPRLWTVGHLTVDDVVLPDGTCHMATAGGAALYAAVGARLAGVASTLVSRRGVGIPASTVERLADLHIDAQLVGSDAPAITQWVLYETDGSRTYVPHPVSGTYEQMSPVPGEHRISRAAAVHLAPMPIAAQAGWVGALHGRARVTLDPHHDSARDAPQDVLAVLPWLAAFLPSELESRHLAGPDPVAALRAYRAAGVPLAVVKLGPEGSLVAADDEIWHVPAAPARVVDVTGAGDSYCGAFSAALARGDHPLDAARWASAAASVVVECLGALLDPGLLLDGVVHDRFLAVEPVLVDGSPTSDRPTRSDREAV
jgi:sugar/nucleoside kinase (ribokinase family)